MDPSRNFTNFLMNQDSPSQYSESSGQISPPTPQSQFHFASPNLLHNFNPFGPPVNQSPYSHSSPRFPSVQHQGSRLQHAAPSFQAFHQPESFSPSPTTQFGAATSRSPSVLQFSQSTAVAGNTSSHGFESSSRCPARLQENELVNTQESSDSSEEEPKRRRRINYTEEENMRLISSWLHNSTDPVIGNDRKSEYYWKAVVQEFNSNAPEGAHKRSVKQLKSHWGDIKREITKFCGVYDRVKKTWSSGQSDDMAMNKAHMIFKSENNEKPFTLEYMWRVVKDLPKWQAVVNEDSANKRTKISSSGAYTSSSNHDTEEDTRNKEKCPEGQKKAKARLKAKPKDVAPSPLGNQPSQNIVLYHEAMTIKAQAMIKSAKEKKYQTYLKLLEKDTSNYSEAQLKRHERVMDQLAKELTEE